MNLLTKLWLLLVGTIPVHIITAILLLGVPRPPAITVENIDRVGWGPVILDADRLWKTRQSKALVTWMPDGSGLVVSARRWILDSRLHTVDAPGAKPRFLRRLPRNVQGLYTRAGDDFMVLARDTDGDEQHRLYRWELDDGAPVPLTPEDERAMFGAFEPDGQRIAYTSTRRNGRDFDVYVMDPRDASTDRLVAEVDGMWGVAAWSPMDDRLLLMHVVSSMQSELFLLDLASGTIERVPGDGAHPARYASVRWSRDGAALYYTSDRDTEFSHLRRLDLATGEETVITDEIPWDVSGVQQSGDGRLLLVAVNEDGRDRLYLTDEWAADMRPLDLFASGHFTAGLHPEEPILLANHVDGFGVTRGYTYDLRTEKLTLWAGTATSEGTGTETRLVRYPTFDEVDGAARQIPAFVYPGVGDGPRPVVIDIHGGPEAQARLRPAGSPLQRRGITVITPNVRGSTGYGRTYASLDDQYLREDAVRDIGALLDWIADQPDMDEERVAVLGGSYGGYMVLASLVHYSPRLRCGIDVVGVSNFVTFLENTADYRRDLRRAEYGDERIPEMRAFLESISPLNNAERITSPLMVIQGRNDPRVPVGESRQLVERVHENGLEVGYMEAANEGHGFRHPWNAFYASVARQEMLGECLAAN